MQKILYICVCRGSSVYWVKFSVWFTVHRGNYRLQRLILALFTAAFTSKKMGVKKRCHCCGKGMPLFKLKYIVFDTYCMYIQCDDYLIFSQVNLSSPLVLSQQKLLLTKRDTKGIILPLSVLDLLLYKERQRLSVYDCWQCATQNAYLGAKRPNRLFLMSVKCNDGRS